MRAPYKVVSIRTESACKILVDSYYSRDEPYKVVRRSCKVVRKADSGRYFQKIAVNRGNLYSWLFFHIRTKNRKDVTGA